MTDWESALQDQVEGRWKANRVFYVAQVKPFLSKQGYDVDTLLAGRQVRHFIDAEMPGLRQIQHDREPTNWGLVPANADVEQPTGKYFERDRTVQRSEFPFPNALRIAFTRPVEAGRTRWLALNPVRFVDLPLGETLNEGLELAPRDISPGVHGGDLVDRIEAFLRSHRIDAHTLSISHPKVPHPLRGRTALHQLLNMMSADDLSRVSIPLDIIRRLLDQTDDQLQ